MSAIDDIREDEGCRLHAYPDPLSGGEPWTIGYGSCGPDIGPDTIWTQEQADAALASRVSTITAELLKALPWLSTVAETRQAVFVNMVYQLGFSGFLAFHRAISYSARGLWQLAGAELLASQWARQTPERAARRTEQLISGVRA